MYVTYTYRMHITHLNVRHIYIHTPLLYITQYETFYTKLKYYFKIQSLATLCLVLNSQAGDIVSTIVGSVVVNFP